MGEQTTSWGKTGQVRLVPDQRYGGTWTDVLVHDRLTASVWFEKGRGWQAGLQDHCVGRMPATRHQTFEQAVLWVLWTKHRDIWNEEGEAPWEQRTGSQDRQQD